MLGVFFLLVTGVVAGCEERDALSGDKEPSGVEINVSIKGAHNVEHSVELEGLRAVLTLDDYPDTMFTFRHWMDVNAKNIVSEDMQYQFAVEEDESYAFEAVFKRNEDISMSGYLSGGFEMFLAMPLDRYYQEAEGLYGDDLQSALESILNEEVTRLSYDDLKHVLEESDEDPENPGHVILIYTRDSVKGEWDYPNWNREHVWPQSKFGSADARTDAHHIAPADVAENSYRGNKPFSSVESGSYEPHDDIKGDVARMLFYMDARYDDLNLSDDPEGNEMGYHAELLQWHFDDPVDDFEKRRNEVIYEHQGNRNPFIDHPQLAWLIYHDHPVVGYD